MIAEEQNSALKFIHALEELAKNIPADEEVKDSRGCYNKKEYLEHVVSDAIQLLKHGEWLVALENALENLYEVQVKLSNEILLHAEEALKNIPGHPWQKDLGLLRE